MSYATAALATFDNVLGTLEHLAGKAQGAGFADALLAEAKLAEDMFPLETQFRIAVNQVRMALGRVWSMENAQDETPYESFAQVRDALATARSDVARAKALEAASADTPVDYTLPNGMRFVMASHEYVRDWTLPNVYFHASTAYGLLRREGLALGKADFLSYMMRYARPEKG